MKTIHFNSMNTQGQYALVDVGEIAALWTELDGAVAVRLRNASHGFLLHQGALPGLLTALAEYRKLIDIILMPEEN